jgi:hypothetical protein
MDSVNNIFLYLKQFNLEKPLTMAIERWTDGRLDQLASLTETNSQQILDLRSSIASLVRIVGQHQDNFEIMLAEIRGLRAENRCILDQLLNREGE